MLADDLEAFISFCCLLSVSLLFTFFANVQSKRSGWYISQSFFFYLCSSAKDLEEEQAGTHMRCKDHLKILINFVLFGPQFV